MKVQYLILFVPLLYFSSCTNHQDAHQPAGSKHIDVYSTPANGELIRELVLHHPYRFTSLYSLKLPGLRKGDVVQVHSQFELTNDLGFNVMLAHAMLLTTNESIIKYGDKPSGIILSNYAGENITRNMHHGFRTLVGSARIDEDGDAYVSVIVYAASDASKPGDKLKVERGYGRLQATVFRN